MGTIKTNEFAPEADTPEAKKATLEQIAKKYRGNDATNQRSRLLEALSKFPVTTLEARRYLDIMHPAGRVKELRRFGWIIETVWIAQATEQRVKHRVGLYVFRGRDDDE
jgi:hypothetical protein